MFFKNSFRFAAVILILLLFACSKGPGTAPGNNGGGGTGGGPTAAVFVLQGNGSNCMNVSVNGTYTQGTAVGASNYISVQVNVTTAGTWSIATNNVAGILFSGSGTFTTTGTQAVTLAATGTPNAAGSKTFTVTAGNSTCTLTLSVTSSGITFLRGSVITAIYFNSTGVTSLNQSDGGSHLDLNLAPSSSIRARLVNVGSGTMTATETVSSLGYKQVAIAFSNINAYTSLAQLDNPDTAGKVQIWVYRDDGLDVMPATGTRPAINKMIFVIGTLPANVIGEGLITLIDYDHASYPVHPPPVTLSSLEGIFLNARWSVSQMDWQ